LVSIKDLKGKFNIFKINVNNSNLPRDGFGTGFFLISISFGQDMVKSLIKHATIKQHTTMTDFYIFLQFKILAMINYQENLRNNSWQP